MTNDDLETEVRKSHRPRASAPTQVADIEDAHSFNRMLDRLFDDLDPKTSQQEADLVALGQLRWTVERLSGLIERDLNQRIRVAEARQPGDSEFRMLSAYKAGMREKEFVLMVKYHLAALKTMNTISTRIDRWTAKPARGKKLPEQ